MVLQFLEILCLTPWFLAKKNVPVIEMVDFKVIYLTAVKSMEPLYVIYLLST